MLQLNNKIFQKLNEKMIWPIVNKINREKILDHRLLFCINSGRSGSEYLATLLGTAKQVVSEHEGEPCMIGDYLDLINKYKYSQTFYQRRYKSLVLKHKLLSLPSETVYADTSHMFIKTFFDTIIEDFYKIEVIILRRYLPKVLKSFVELGYFSDKSRGWPFWFSLPNATTAAIKCIDLEKNLYQYDLCIAYLIDIEARAIRFKKQYPWIKTHEIRLESLNNPQFVKTWFEEELFITPTNQTNIVISQKINEKKESKKSRNITADLEYCQERIYKYIEKATSLGIEIPKSLALDPE